jgi:hypothetical protein
MRDETRQRVQGWDEIEGAKEVSRLYNVVEV